MGWSLEIRESASIHDLFMDAARHFVSNICIDKSLEYAYISIEPRYGDLRRMSCVFEYGPFRFNYMGLKVYKDEEYGWFSGTDEFACKWSVLNKEWLDRDEPEFLFECAQEFMQVCVKLKNGEIEPFPDEEEEDV